MLSLSEILPSPRIVKKFSVTRRWAEKPNDAVFPSALVLAETGQKGRYFVTLLSTQSDDFPGARFVALGFGVTLSGFRQGPVRMGFGTTAPPAVVVQFPKSVESLYAVPGALPHKSWRIPRRASFDGTAIATGTPFE